MGLREVEHGQRRCETLKNRQIRQTLGKKTEEMPCLLCLQPISQRHFQKTGPRSALLFTSDYIFTSPSRYRTYGGGADNVKMIFRCHLKKKNVDPVTVELTTIWFKKTTMEVTA